MQLGTDVLLQVHASMSPELAWAFCAEGRM